VISDALNVVEDVEFWLFVTKRGAPAIRDMMTIIATAIPKISFVELFKKVAPRR
jgi:hypothetical protein